MGTGDQVSGLGGAETLRWGWSPDGEVAAAVSRRQEWVLRLEERQEKWVIPDHGGIEYGHGGVSTDEMIVPWGIVGPGIPRGKKMEEPNNTVNTAAVILHLFKIKQPACWTGEVPASIGR